MANYYQHPPLAGRCSPQETEKVNDAETFTAEEREVIGDLVEAIIADKDCPDVSGDGSTFYLVNEKVVDWCMAHPAPIPHTKNPKLRP